MFGQFAEWLGAVDEPPLEFDGAVVDVLPPDELLVWASAAAAPPPISAPESVTATSACLNRRVMSFTSLRSDMTPASPRGFNAR